MDFCYFTFRFHKGFIWCVIKFPKQLLQPHTRGSHSKRSHFLQLWNCFLGEDLHRTQKVQRTRIFRGLGGSGHTSFPSRSCTELAGKNIPLAKKGISMAWGRTVYLPTCSLIFISEILGTYKPFRPMNPYLVGG